MHREMNRKRLGLEYSHRHSEKGGNRIYYVNGHYPREDLQAYADRMSRKIGEHARVMKYFGGFIVVVER